MKKPVAKPPAGKRRKAAAAVPPPSEPTVPCATQNGAARPEQNGQPAEPAIVGDGRLPSSMMRSYALLTPDLKELYFKFYKATYGKTRLDLKTKEFIAIAAALALNCKGCLEGHLKKAKREGATAEEISEVIAVTLGVAAAAIVDRSDIANYHLGGLFEKPE
ncbi:MAG TPA: carboxymuconolactone decarboxylase family protein [Planctomycetota bacterium]|nr:carboxymuconolactone decarboxylase family protein [Planctomycetota bacterium]